MISLPQFFLIISMLSFLIAVPVKDLIDVVSYFPFCKVTQKTLDSPFKSSQNDDFELINGELVLFHVRADRLVAKIIIIIIVSVHLKLRID